MKYEFLKQSIVLLFLPFFFVSFALKAQGASCESADAAVAMESLSQVGKELEQAMRAAKEGSEEKPELAEQTLYFVTEFNQRDLPPLQEMANKISGADLATARDTSKRFLKRVQSILRLYGDDQLKLEVNLKDPSIPPDTKNLLGGLKLAKHRIFKVIQEMQKNLETEVSATCSGFAFYAKTKWNGEATKEDMRFWQCKTASEELAKEISSLKRDEKRCYYSITCGKSLEGKKVIPLTGMIYSVSCEKAANGCPSERDCAGEGKISKALDLGKKKVLEGSK